MLGDRFAFSDPHRIHVKRKGEMTVYFLTGSRPNN
jgi:hypothetical protein